MKRPAPLQAPRKAHSYTSLLLGGSLFLLGACSTPPDAPTPSDNPSGQAATQTTGQTQATAQATAQNLSGDTSLSQQALTNAETQPSRQPSSASITTDGLSELGRIDTAGMVFGIAQDSTGEVLVTTRQGRPAVYWLTANTDWNAPPLALPLSAHALLYPLAPGRFAALHNTEGTLELVEATLKPTPTLKRSGKIVLGGKPSQLSVADGLLWVVDRAAPGGLGLLAVDPLTGKVSERIETGPNPAILTTSKSGTKERLLLGIRGEEGAVLIVELEERRSIYKIPVEGLPESIVSIPNTSILYATRSGRSDLLILDADQHKVLDEFKLSFVPTTLLPSSDGSALFVLSAQGRLARLELQSGGRSPQVGPSISLGAGSTQIARWSEDSLILLDHQGRSLRWLRAQDLSTRATLPLNARVGKLSVDPNHHRLFVTLPELEQVVVVQVDPASTSKEPSP